MAESDVFLCGAGERAGAGADFVVVRLAWVGEALGCEVRQQLGGFGLGVVRRALVAVGDERLPDFGGDVRCRAHAGVYVVPNHVMRRAQRFADLGAEVGVFKHLGGDGR